MPETKQSRRLWLAGLVILEVLLVVAASFCSSPSLFNYAIQVQERKTGNDVPDAQVRIDVGEGNPPLAGITDEFGFATITIDASYSGQRALLTVKATGYEEHTQYVSLVENTLALPVQLDPKAIPDAGPTPTSDVVEPTASLEPTEPVSTPTPTPTPIPDNVATAIQGAGIFAAPDADSQLLGGVALGEQVAVEGRSEYGHWFYVRDDQGVEGFVYAPRFEWAGDYESLPVVPSTVPPPPAATSTPTSPLTPYPPLELELWPIGGGCGVGIWCNNVYMGARGGDGTYTYYWNDELKCGPTGGVCTFEICSGGGAKIGLGRVVSGDGQVAEDELYVSKPDCSGE